MKYLISFFFFFLSFTSSAQKLTYELGVSVMATNGVGETTISSTGFFPDFGYEARTATAASLQVHYTLSESIQLISGVGLSSYRYKPVNAPMFGSQGQNGGFRDIGFNENGLVENTFIYVPLGIGSTLDLGFTSIYPQFSFNINYSLRESPVLRLNQEFNKVFLTGAFSLGFKLVEINALSLMLSPFIEMKPYRLDMDHAYSDEKIILVGVRLSIRLHTK